MGEVKIGRGGCKVMNIHEGDVADQLETEEL